MYDHQLFIAVYNQGFKGPGFIIMSYHVFPRPRGRGGVLHQIFGTRVQHVIQIWTQSDLRFCDNNGSKDLKSMKKGSFVSKIKGKFIQNA